MNPSPVEEVSAVAQSVTSALKSTPVVLALVVFNVVFMGLIAYLSVHNANRWNNEVERWEKLVQSCLPSQQR